MKIIGTKPLILHTYEEVKASGVFDRVYIVSDQWTFRMFKEYCRICSSEYGIVDDYFPVTSWIVISKEVGNGTERVYEAAKYLGLLDNDDNLIVNVQGDMVGLSPFHLRSSVDFNRKLLREGIGTLFCPVCVDEFSDVDTVKVIINRNINSEGEPIEAIGFFRNGRQEINGNKFIFKHIGIYTYLPAMLKEYFKYGRTKEERKISLEQLRIFAMGRKIFANYICSSPFAIDNQRSLFRARKLKENQRL
jgi:3-deoxy-manno-octulosonate cytidylyltransferase (CMP-KDO synthetase)